MRVLLSAVSVLALITGGLIQAEPPGNWSALARLSQGDRIRVVTTSGRPVEAPFEGWTSADITVGAARLAREDVRRVERRRGEGWGRANRAGIGALVGFSAGFVIGAAVSNNCSVGPCRSRGEIGAIVGGLGLVGGALVGAALPSHGTEVLYQTPSR